MSSPVSSKIIGLKKFEKALARLDDVAAAKNLDLAGVAGALPIRNAAAENAPKITRTLARSIHIGRHTELTPGFSPGEGYSDIGGPKPTRDKVEIRIGTNLVYAPVQEFGTTFLHPNLWGRGIQAVIHIPAQPYLRPAFDANIEKAKKEVAIVLAKLLDRVAK